MPTESKLSASLPTLRLPMLRLLMLLTIGCCGAASVLAAGATAAGGAQQPHAIYNAAINYHHDAGGKWRVARDAWNSDLALPAP